MHPTRPRARPLLWLIALLTLVPIALFFWAWALPANHEATLVQLAGAWEARSFDGPDTPAAWKPIKLPGSFNRQGFAVGEHLLLRKRFSLPPDVVGHDGAFVIGNVRGAYLRMRLNGEPIGTKGISERDFIGVEAASETHFVPARLLQPADNVLELEVTGIPMMSRDGIVDPRMLFGRHDVLAPWAFHERQVREVLEHGALVAIALLTIVLISLWRLQGDKVRTDLYRGALMLMAASGSYLVGKSGFLLTAVLSASAMYRVVVYSVFFLGVAISEFVEAYFLGRVTRFRQATRLVSLAAALLATVGFSNAYRYYTLWLFALTLYSTFVGTRALVRRQTVFGPLVVVAVYVIAGAGISDLLGDLDVVYAPRLFTFAVANMAVMAGAVVMGEFVELAAENTRLSASLQTRNEELADALVKAEESSRVKSEFLANTSHELRTPLNAIINIPQGLLEQFHEVRRIACAKCGARFELDAGEEAPPTCPACQQPGLALDAQLSMDLAPDETSRLLKSVVRSGNHLLAVVNDILDYSKLEAGRVVLHRESTPIEVLLEDLRLAMEPVATRSGVKLAFESNVAGVTLELDRVKLSQVLINLTGNAIKFSDGKGTVTVSAKATAATVTLAVRDEGIGIAPEHQALIFEGFRQVEGSSTRRFGGSGLGLAISKRLVGMHGGTLRVESALGHGSTFVVELPRVAAAVETAATVDGQVVVVVDDETSAIDTTTVALKPLGCRIVPVMEPRDALARLREAKPALIILDVMMPRVSGLEVLRQLRDDAALKDVPVLVSSAFPDNQRSAEALGATFIAKPWRAGELLRISTSLLAQRRAAGRTPENP